MDLKVFLRLLLRYKWVLILVPLVALLLTFFLVKNLPKEYKSQVQMSTGLVDQSRQVASENQNTDFFKVNQQFSNIMEMMKMKKTMSTLSYSLILHDLLSAPESFKQYSEEIKKLNATDLQNVISLYSDKLFKKEVITTVDSGKYKLYDLLVSMGYDEISLNKKLSIYRIDNSDFINIEYTSENPLLSAFVVNTLSGEFINTYSANVSSNQNKSISVLDSLVKKKEMAMNSKNSELKNYKINNGVLNLDKQSEIIYKQITDYEERKSQALREIQSNQGAIANLNRKLNGTDQKYLGGGLVKENTNIVALNNQIKIASNNYIDNGFKPSDQRKVDSLQTLLTKQMQKSSDDNITDPVATKQSLIQQKNSMEIAVSLAQNSLRSIDAELNQLKAKYNTMVPFDAGVQNFERDADVATKEYMDALNRYNQSNVEKSIGLKLQVAQMGLPGPPEPSKKLIYMALSGISSFSFCLLIIFSMFLLDHTINNTKQLSGLNIGRVLGNINFIEEKDKDPRVIWGDNDKVTDFIVFKDLMRSLRFEISKTLDLDSGSKILGVTSVKSGEGKTFFTSALAYAFAMTGKKILLIGDDYTNRQPAENEKSLVTSQYFENFLVKKEIKTEDLITFLNKSSTSNSLLEIQSSSVLKAGFDYLKEKFDLILIDVDSLRSVNKAKEWLSFTDHSIAIFEAGSEINENDKEFVNYIRNHEGFAGWVLNKVKIKELNEKAPL
ncbi:exopolysaccharide transport family protein [Pedobacter steynii]|uniref:Lipopolysaccharide biosynthesis protein n=1 Tax=Pedobacter steynii TaxID=430522 RepID=A0A1D7QNV4_9SPHI|nr:AAA family ATPase [Pedobacter steynii]AOM80336.1 lipopolysaccharide biosynthesis protein [Pedobacter steynii]